MICKVCDCTCIGVGLYLLCGIAHNEFSHQGKFMELPEYLIEKCGGTVT